MKKVKDKELDKARIHDFWWSIVLLSLIIIGLGSFILSKRVIGSDMLMSYISFASMLLSITLSIFAILYTYTSNVEVQRQFEKIDSAADAIQKTASELIITENKLKERTESIDKHLENIYTQLDDMNQRDYNSDDFLPFPDV